jgi:hypothetical protein
MAFTPIKQHVKRGTGSRNQFTGPARTCSTTWRDVYMQTMHVRRTLPRMHAWTHTSMDRTFPPQTPRQTWSMNADRVDGMGWSRLQAILPTAKVQQRLATCKRCIDPLYLLLLLVRKRWHESSHPSSSTRAGVCSPVSTLKMQPFCVGSIRLGFEK